MSFGMYRGRGPIHEGWRQLQLIDQWLMGVINDDRTTTRIGSTDIYLNRWRNTAVGVSRDDIEESIERLTEQGWALVCPQTDLLWLTNYMLEREVWRQPNRLRAVMREAERCGSPVIREAALEQIAGFAQGAGAVIRPSRKPISPYVRLAVYERDKWTCQECKHVIPPTEPEHFTGELAPYDETGWLEVDHKVPWSNYGPDTVENLRALCTPCNQSRGTKPLPVVKEGARA